MPFKTIEEKKEYAKLWYNKNKEITQQRSKKNTIKKKSTIEGLEKERKRGRDYYKDNITDRKKYSKKYRQDNKETIDNKRKEYYKNNEDKKILRKEYSRLYQRKRKHNDPLYKLKSKIRNLIWQSLMRKNFTKKSRTFVILDCSFEDFKQHLELKFEDWMNWDNYGLYNGELNYGWDIDHIIPVSSGTTEEDVIRLNHYTNLQPLCSKVNRDIKRNKITP